MTGATTRKRVAVFISGGGSNMLSLAKAAEDPAFPAEIVCVIADKSTAGGLEKARAMGIPALSFERKAYAGKPEHEAAMIAALEEFQPDILCLAGFMRLLSGDFINRYEGRIINIHPSILPLFPGLHTHQRAIDSGMKIHGCTVHFVTEGMDEGPVIAQGAVPVIDGDTAETLAGRLLAVEHKLYPLALSLFAQGRVRMEDGRAVRNGATGDGSASLISAF